MLRAAVAALLALTPSAVAGLHLSTETANELPARWRGFLADHRALRLLALPGGASPLHDAYADARLRLESAARLRPLAADEAADLGALHLRLGDPAKALAVLRPAARTHPDHFQLAANLGTAWQRTGDLDQAAAALADAVRLAPPRWRPFEDAHLRLVRLRRAEGKAAATAPDDLFSVRWTGEPGKPVRGLPADAVAVAQQLALWLPADGRLLWLAGETANAGGDVRTAAAILDGCVTEFALGPDLLRRHRQAYRAAVEAADAANDHARFTPTTAFRSARPLARTFDPSRLPAIDPTGPTPLPWAALAETTVGRRFPPTYLPFVDKLDGRRVTVTGHVRPGGDAGGFLLTEYPVGCWFCETPDPTALVNVEPSAGTPTDAGRTAVTVTGTLRLNRTDPEGYLFRLTDATVKRSD
jgi:tetratricopeptide (TPR) repeat protein